jgi:phosphoenolpyruvate phosphomutase
MVEIGGQSLLGHIVDAYNKAGVKDITVVRGYLADAVDLPSLDYVDNPDYAESGELVSLAHALEANPDNDADLFISYGDVIFRRYILDSMAETDGDFIITVDADWRDSVNRGRAADYVTCTEPHSRHTFYREVFLEKAGESLSGDRCHGEWMGFLKVSAPAMSRFRDTVADMMSDPVNRKAKLHQLLCELVSRGEKIRVIYTTGHWLDVDSLDDVLAAGSFA